MEKPPQPPLSPRAGIVAGLAPEYLAVGWHKKGRWVTAAEVSRPGGGGSSENGSVHSLPYLDGVLLTGERPAAASAGDYGGVVRKEASAMLRPGTAGDIARFVQFAAKHRIAVAPRGQGHTLWGQSQVAGGVRIDLRLLNGVGPVADGTVEVDAGATWRSVLQVTLTHGFTPPVLTDYLSLTVGGTLSVGGVSGTSWRYGTQGDNVEALTVVTGEGEVVRCSESENRDLFDAVLAGQGQCGIITSARLRLVPAPQKVRVFMLPYADLHGAMEDQRMVVQDGRFDAAVIFIVPGPQGWMYLLETLKWLKAGDTADDDRLLDGLSHLPGAHNAFTQAYLGYADRVQAQIGDLEAVDLASAPHPWIDVFAGGSVAEQLVSETLAGLSPADLGRSFPILVYAFRREVLTRPMFRVPDEPYLVLFDILRAATPGATDVAAMVEQNREVFKRNQGRGGTHYPISAVDLTPEDWRNHYGPVWPQLEQAKLRYDPRGILTPGPGIFA